MSAVQTETGVGTLRVLYDGAQHCTAVREPQGKTVAMDACSGAGGKGEELSPANLVGSGLGGCMLLAMGAVALRDELDITGTRVDVDVSMTDKRIGAIDLSFAMPRSFSAADRVKLERATGLCPIKPSFHPDVAISVRFDYPG